LPEQCVAIIGTGNVLCRDDGVGVHIIRELQKHDLPQNVSLVDAGTSTIDAFLDEVDSRKIIVIDAVKGGGKPGSIYRFPLDGVSPERPMGMTSLHQISLHDSYRMACLILDQAPEVIVIGVEPGRIDVGTELSRAVRSRYREIIDIVLSEIGVAERGGLRSPLQGGLHDRH
jgi:hydrogenase maturation protease